MVKLHLTKVTPVIEALFGWGTLVKSHSGYVVYEFVEYEPSITLPLLTARFNSAFSTNGKSMSELMEIYFPSVKLSSVDAHGVVSLVKLIELAFNLNADGNLTDCITELANGSNPNVFNCRIESKDYHIDIVNYAGSVDLKLQICETLKLDRIEEVLRVIISVVTDTTLGIDDVDLCNDVKKNIINHISDKFYENLLNFYLP